MSTPLSAFYPMLRSLLGDEEVQGEWEFQDAELDSAMRSVFATAKQPAGYILLTGADGIVTMGNLADATKISPDVSLGADAARIAYETVLVILRPLDTAIGYVTRTLSTKSQGDGRKEMLSYLERELRAVDAANLLGTWQSLREFVAGAPSRGDWIDFGVDGLKFSIRI